LPPAGACPQEPSADSGGRWNISALTENHIDALELRTAPCVPRPEPRCDHGRIDMSATGLDVFDKTLRTTNIWLDEIMAKLGPDRHA
jgi:hypothetical protein